MCHKAFAPLMSWFGWREDAHSLTCGTTNPAGKAGQVQPVWRAGEGEGGESGWKGRPVGGLAREGGWRQDPVLMLDPNPHFWPG